MSDLVMPTAPDAAVEAWKQRWPTPKEAAEAEAARVAARQAAGEVKQERARLLARLAAARKGGALTAEREEALTKAEKDIRDADAMWEFHGIEEIIDPTSANKGKGPKPAVPVQKPSLPKPGERGFDEALAALGKRVAACVLTRPDRANPDLVAELAQRRKETEAEMTQVANDWGLDEAEKIVLALEKRFAEIKGIEDARVELIARVLGCGTAQFKTIRPDLVEGFEKQRKEAQTLVAQAAPPESAEPAVAGLEKRHAELAALEEKAAATYTKQFNGAVDTTAPNMKLAGIAESNRRMITVDNADEFADLMAQDKVVFTALRELEANRFVATIVSTSAKRPENPLPRTAMAANKIDLSGSRTREHYGWNEIHLNAADRYETTRVMVDDNWVEQVIVNQGAAAKSLWNSGRKEWNYQIVVDKVEWKNFHIMFTIKGDTISVFHVGPGG
jgi:hypothetical protein